MPTETREVRPFSKPRHVLAANGAVLAAPDDWTLLPPGDAALSRRIKQDGPTWTVIEMKGRKRFSRGIWASTTRITALRNELATERADPAYRQKLQAGRVRRAEAQEHYVEDFRSSVLLYLRFHPRYAVQAQALADRISAHATPVGSGTVARTQRIPLEERAEAATIAWLRHQTTAYDHMKISRERGLRREIRRMLAQRSTQLLAQYRSGGTVDSARCPLQAALNLPPINDESSRGFIERAG